MNHLRPARHIIVSAKLELHAIERTGTGWLCIPSRSGQVGFEKPAASLRCAKIHSQALD